MSVCCRRRRCCECRPNYQCDDCYIHEDDVDFLEYDAVPPQAQQQPIFSSPITTPFPRFAFTRVRAPTTTTPLVAAEALPFPSFPDLVENLPSPSEPPPDAATATATPVEASLPVAFGDLPTPPPSPRHTNTDWYPPFFDRLPNLTQPEDDPLPLPIQLFPSLGQSSPRPSPCHTPPLSPVPFHLLDDTEVVATPTATEASEDFAVEPVVLLDPLKMHAGSTPFQRKPKKPRCKKTTHTDGWVSLKLFKSDVTC